MNEAIYYHIETYEPLCRKCTLVTDIQWTSIYLLCSDVQPLLLGATILFGPTFLNPLCHVYLVTQGLCK